MIFARDFITKFRKAENPEAAAARHPVTRKVHHHGLHCSGPNEEWCMDGHEKILQAMGIAVWGINDKYARVEIDLYAVPNARISEVPPVLYLRTLRKRGFMAVTNASDKGTELTRLIPLIMTLRYVHYCCHYCTSYNFIFRKKYQPYISEDTLPSYRAVKSVFNITRERGWRPIWEKELGNVLHEYIVGKEIAQFQENDTIHA